MIRVVAAFVAGVVVALGSALIYVRVSDMVHPPVAQTSVVSQEPPPTQLPDAGQDTSDQAAPAPRPAPEDQPGPPVPIEHAVKQKAVLQAHHPIIKPAIIKPVIIKPAVRHDQPAHRTFQIAQNHAPAYPPVTSPVPAVAAPASPPPQAVSSAPVNDGNQQLPAETRRPQSNPESQPQDAPPSVPVRQPHIVTLRSGTSLTVRLTEALSTDHNYTGDSFRATLESPIVMDGFIIADKGSKILGRIANAQKAGRVEGVSDLTLTLTEINTTDNQRVRIDTSSYDKRGPASTGRDGAEVAGGAALGAIIGAVAGGGRGAAIGAGAGTAAGAGTVLATRGKAAVLPSETRLTFRLATPVTITEKLNY